MLLKGSHANFRKRRAAISSSDGSGSSGSSGNGGRLVQEGQTEVACALLLADNATCFFLEEQLLGNSARL